MAKTMTLEEMGVVGTARCECGDEVHIKESPSRLRVLGNSLPYAGQCQGCGKWSEYRTKCNPI